MAASTEDAIRELFATETENARSVLHEARDRNTAVKLVVQAAQRAERTFLPVVESVACKPGCSFCCRGTRVDVTAPEALTIARGFRETLSKEDIAVILRKSLAKPTRDRQSFRRGDVDPGAAAAEAAAACSNNSTTAGTFARPRCAA